MGRITIDETIKAPVATVFAYVDDYRNTTKYMKDLSKWQKYPNGGEAKWKVTDGYMEVGGGDIITKDKFKGMKLHVEFMPPYMPEAKGQARGNSGVFIMDNYEVQVLDSYGLPKLEVGDCAALYSKKTPDNSLIRMRRVLPTDSGSTCSYVLTSFRTACTCMPPLCAKAEEPT